MYNYNIWVAVKRRATVAIKKKYSWCRSTNDNKMNLHFLSFIIVNEGNNF